MIRIYYTPRYPHPYTYITETNMSCHCLTIKDLYNARIQISNITRYSQAITNFISESVLVSTLPSLNKLPDFLEQHPELLI